MSAYKYWVEGEYGPQTCVSGRVWREAFDGDTVCVTPDIRAANLAANAAAASNTQGSQPQTPVAQSTIVLDVTGSGEVYAVWSDPFGQVAGDHTKMPFSKSYPLPADEDYVSLTWTSRDDSPKGCRITVDNTGGSRKGPWAPRKTAYSLADEASESQPPKLFRVALPVLGDLDAQVEIHLRAE